MQRNPQSPQGQPQRPTARPQQRAYTSDQRPVVRPQQPQSSAVRPAGRTVQQPPRNPSQQRMPASGTPQQPVRRPVQQPSAVRQPVPAQQRRPAPAPHARIAPIPGNPVFRGRRDNQPLVIAAIAAVLIIGLGCLFQYVIYPGGYFPSDTARAVTAVAEIASSRGVRINEVMTSNKTALSDEGGDYPDWIELLNTSSSAVDISGWALLDKASRSTYFTFPEYQLQPGEAVIVFASGHLANENGSAFHAPFRLSASGDTLMLSDSHSTVVESINIPALGANQSYAQADGGWIVTSEYTPGMENTSLNYAALTSTQPVAGSTLIISEIMADNASYSAADGSLHDWIEIQNIGTSEVNLSGYALSDSAAAPSQWKFPSVVIQPGQCLVVYASGLNQQAEDGTLHTSFGLRAEGESVLLYSPSGQVLDYVEFDNLKTDQSISRRSDGTYTTSGTPTPGQAN